MTSRDALFALMEAQRGSRGKLFKIFDTLCAHRWFPRFALFSSSLSLFLFSLRVTNNTRRTRTCTFLIRMRVILHPFDAIRPANLARKILAAESRRLRFSKYNSSHATAAVPDKFIKMHSPPSCTRKSSLAKSGC